MIVTIHQPEHLPWLGFFNKMAKADIFVILDSVQYRKNYFQNRNKIIGSNGVQFVSIPVKTKGHMDTDIAHTEISTMGGNAKWKEKYLRTIKMSYGKHPFFEEVYDIIEQSLLVDTNLLCDINIMMIKLFAQKLKIDVKFIRSSDMNIDAAKSDLIHEICTSLCADCYIAGPYGREYLNVDEFTKNGINVVYNDYNHPIYYQRKTKEFVSHLSAVDLFMNCGWDESKCIIMDGNKGVSVK
ncbi:MAG: WbqC family protein [Butyrivibrio sp.]|nr:WbqC family protein [Butyrivibrio sp.]